MYLCSYLRRNNCTADIHAMRKPKISNVELEKLLRCRLAEQRGYLQSLQWHNALLRLRCVAAMWEGPVLSIIKASTLQ